MLHKYDMKFALIPIVGKTSFSSHTKPIAKATQGSTSFMWDNMEFLSFRNKEQEGVPWCSEIQNKRSSNMGRLSIFTLIPYIPKMCGLSISYVSTCSRENVFKENCISLLIICTFF